jgi:hypothetical protein
MNIVKSIRGGEPREKFADRIHVSPKTVQRREADQLPDLRFVAHVIKTTGAEWAIPVCLKQVEVALKNMIGQRERHQLRTDA